MPGPVSLPQPSPARSGHPRAFGELLARSADRIDQIAAATAQLSKSAEARICANAEIINALTRGTAAPRRIFGERS